MRSPSYSGQFKRDVKLAGKRGKELTKSRTLLNLLMEGKVLPAHIEPDWLLIYKVTDKAIHFERTGTHADLFE